MTRDPVLITAPYLLYERFSIKVDESMAIERQRADNEAQAERLGWSPTQHLPELASAWRKKGARPKFNAMVDAIRSGQARGVIVWNLDRLLRRTDELEVLISAVEAAPPGFQIHTAHGELDLGTAEGRFAARVLTAVAQKSSDDTSRRVKRARQDKPLIVPLFGERPDQRPVLDEIIQRALQGEAMARIARDLTARGVPTKRGNAIWQVSTISRMLKNPRLVERGLIAPRDFETLQLVIARPNPNRETPMEFILRGLLRCSQCGRMMVAGGQAYVGDTTRGRYRCNPPKGCGMAISPATGYDQLIVDRIRARLEAESLSIHTSTPKKSKTPSRDDILKKIHEIDDQFAAGKLSFDRWERLSAQLNARLPEPIMSVRTTPALDEFNRAMAGSIAEKRATLMRAIEVIDVLPGVRGKKGVDPHRLHVQAR